MCLAALEDVCVTAFCCYFFIVLCFAVGVRCNDDIVMCLLYFFGVFVFFFACFEVADSATKIIYIVWSVLMPSVRVHLLLFRYSGLFCG